MSEHQSRHADPPSRRKFLTQSAALIATGVPALGVARSAHAAGSDVIRIGIVGCGGRGAGAAMDAMTADPGTRLVAMADLFPDRQVSGIAATDLVWGNGTLHCLTQQQPVG